MDSRDRGLDPSLDQEIFTQGDSKHIHISALRARRDDRLLTQVFESNYNV